MDKKIERTLEEVLKFCNEINWYIGDEERMLMLDKITPKQYLNTYYSSKEAQKFVDFLFGKEYEIGTFGKAWGDNSYCVYGFLVDKSALNNKTQFYIADEYGDNYGYYDNFEPLTEIPKFNGNADV